jgi:hypothetical protein
MLHRITFSIVLVMLFAFAQIQTVTHAISHFNTTSQQNQQDQHTAPDQCSQCITVAHAAAGVIADVVAAWCSQADFLLSSHLSSHHAFALPAVYSARAPPNVLL